MIKLSPFLCFLLLIVSCKKANVKTHLTKISAKTITIDSSLKSSEKINSFINPYKTKLTAEMNEKLSYAPKDFTRTDGNMQSSLGNLMADLCFTMAKEKSNTPIDFTMLNYGGIRATVPQGNITNESAFKLMPFENELVAVTISGKKVHDLVTYFINNKKAHPLSKNIALVIKKDGYSLQINGKPFDENKDYTVLTSDYLQNGGDRMVFFKDPKKLVKLDYKVRDAIIGYFKTVDTVKATTDNRVIIK